MREKGRDKMKRNMVSMIEYAREEEREKNQRKRWERDKEKRKRGVGKRKSVEWEGDIYTKDTMKNRKIIEGEREGKS